MNYSKRRALLLFAVLTLVMTLPASAQGPGDWAEYPSNPIFGQGIGGPKAYYPSVVYDADSFSGHGVSAKYKMWYGTSGNQTALATSDDGIAWVDQGIVMTNGYHATVEYYAGGFPGSNNGANPSPDSMYYRMWYWNPAFLYQVDAIAYCESPDGEVWYNDQPVQNGPVPIVSGVYPSWNRGSYGPCDVLYDSGASNSGTDWTFTMYYDGTTGGDEAVGLGFSSDAITWTGYDADSDGKADAVLSGTYVSGDWDENYVSRATIIKNADDDFQMWYSGGVGTMHHGIGYATSSDGVNWTRDVVNPILHTSDGVAWRDDRAYCPAVILDGTGYKMWFAGKDGTTGHYSIGYATSPPPDTVWVDDDYDAVGCSADGHTWQVDCFDILGDGVAAVAPGGTVHVAPGLYDSTNGETFPITLDKSVTVEGPQAGIDPRPCAGSTRTAGDTSTEAIIDGGGVVATVLDIEASDAVIDGLEVRNATGDMIESDPGNEIANVVLRYNIIHEALGDEGMQIRYCRDCVVEYNHVYDIAQDGINMCCGSTSGFIHYNEVHDINSENAALYFYDATNLTIQCNLVYNTTQNEGIKLGNKSGSNAANSGGSIRYNMVHDTAQDGIAVYMSDVLVQGNEVYHSTSENGAIYVAWEVSNVTIQYNAVHENTLNTGKWGDPGGIMIGTAVYAASVHVNHNNIYGNLPNGVTNKAQAVLDATGNWWGDDEGPSGAGPGSGDAVSSSVDFDPWLDAPEIIVNPCLPDSEGPVTTAVVATPNPVSVGSSVALTANVDDTDTGGSDIASAEYSLDGGAWMAMAAQDGGFDEVSEDVEASSAAPGAAGIYDLCVRGTDEPGNTGDAECIMLVVYDPEGGFVTGGGWIDSPAGAYKPDATLAGKATFGFVSKYKKGASVPEGNTEFQFKAGNLNFHSTAYDWLVVNRGGTRAQFKGSGTINGSGDYKFMLWAGDGEPDTFRIRIWSEENGPEVVVYDNGTDQAIGGGSIVVHTK
jgi:hypothetical protein